MMKLFFIMLVITVGGAGVVGLFLKHGSNLLLLAFMAFGAALFCGWMFGSQIKNKEIK